MKKIIQIVLSIGVLAALIILFNPEEITILLAGITPQSLMILFSLQLLTLMAGAWIWYYLLSRQSKISFTWVFIINQAAGLVESLTPSVKFGGEAAKIYLFRKISDQTYQGLTGTLMVHKFVTMFPFTLLCLLIFFPSLYYFDLPVFSVAVLIMVLAMCFVLGWLCYGKSGKDPLPGKPGNTGNNRPKSLKNIFTSRQWILKTVSFLNQARNSASGLLTFGETRNILLVSFAIWVLYPIKVFLVCIFLGIEVSPVIIGLATLFAYMVSMVPLLPGGLGTYEGSMAMFFTLGGLSPAEGLAISLVSRLTTFWFPLALSALACAALCWKDNLIKDREQARQAA